MAGEIYGWGGGQRLADSDNQQALLAALASQEAAGKIAMQPAQLRTANAQAGLTEAQAAAAKLTLDQSMRAREIARQAAQQPQTAGALAAGGAAPTGGGMIPAAGAMAADPTAPMMNIAQQHWDLGQRYRAEGLTTQADAEYKAGNEAAEKASVVGKNAAEAAGHEADNINKKADIMERLTRDIKPGDVAGLKAANDIFEKMYGPTGWTPEVGASAEVLQKIKDRAESMKDRADRIRKDFAEKSLDAAHTAQETRDYATARKEDEQILTEKVRRQAIEKASGKPNKGDIKMADALVADKFPDMAKETRYIHANEIAERANAIIAANKANGTETPNGASIAMNKAFEELNAAGNFKDYRKDPKATGQMTGRESQMINRVVLSGNEAVADLENISKLPLTASTGVFGGRGQAPGIMNAAKEVLANKLTSQEVQSYNVMSAGFTRSLAAIEAAGLVPSGQLTHQMDAIVFKEGDTNLTKMQRMAQTRQIVEKGLETIATNPRVPEETKKHINEIIDKAKSAVPFTQQDLMELQKRQETNPKATLKDVVKSKPSETPATGLPEGWSVKEH